MDFIVRIVLWNLANKPNFVEFSRQLKFHVFRGIGLSGAIKRLVKDM